MELKLVIVPSEGDELSTVPQALEEIRRLIIKGHRLEMTKIDETTDMIAAQLTEIAGNLPDDQQATKLKALAAKLNGIGKSS